jgi:hypothetical protein
MTLSADAGSIGNVADAASVGMRSVADFLQAVQ